ncbi:hypothetical protein C8J57DRAFT_1458501 [Mycena rebaudengoi]|nr:hypothetical protein C8J57DRAFT_1458501 [Mycena rebaudengoi]
MQTTRPSLESGTMQDSNSTSPTAPTPDVPFSGQFLDKSPAAAAARAAYIKALFGGVMALCVLIFGVCSIYWGAVWQTPHHPVHGWIVDFDGGSIGQGVSRALRGIPTGRVGVVWEVVPAAQFPGGISQLESAVVEEKAFVAVSINTGASANLAAAASAADASYNGSLAITFIGVEARNENMFRLLRAMIEGQLEGISQKFALQFAQNVSSSTSIATLLATAPQIVTRPIGYATHNARPFDIPVASAVTFVGLIYLLILSFFIVLISSGARQASGLEQRLTLGSLIRLRISSSFLAYFIISLVYTLLSRAFQLPFDRRFGSAGFVIFWVLNWLGMLATGLAIESMLTLLTIRFVPFFLLLWIVSNISVSIFPIQVLPHIYRYGYAFPFYNISRAVRTIVFSTKNDVGTNFGILIGWVVLSCLTMSLFQWFVRRREVKQVKQVPHGKEQVEEA